MIYIWNKIIETLKYVVSRFFLFSNYMVHLDYWQGGARQICRLVSIDEFLDNVENAEILKYVVEGSSKNTSRYSSSSNRPLKWSFWTSKLVPQSIRAWQIDFEPKLHLSHMEEGALFLPWCSSFTARLLWLALHKKCHIFRGTQDSKVLVLIGSRLSTLQHNPSKSIDWEPQIKDYAKYSSGQTHIMPLRHLNSCSIEL